MGAWGRFVMGFKRVFPSVTAATLLTQCCLVTIVSDALRGCNLSQMNTGCGDGTCTSSIFEGRLAWEDATYCPEDCAPSPTAPVPPPPPPPGPTATATATSAPAAFCGNGVCNTATENTDLCPADCVCTNDGECRPGEGANCRDCTPNLACGAACASDDECPAGMTCFNGTCWEDCICEGDCGPDEGGGGGPVFICDNPCNSDSECYCRAGGGVPHCVNNCCVCQ